jgi:oligopeptide transport system substrate-binding protein
LLYVLTMHYGHVVAREAVEYYGDAFSNHPVGTGPYVLASWQRNYRIEFVRNPKWAETGRQEFYPESGAPGDAEAGLLADAGKPVPFIDRIIQYVVGDPSTAWLMFLSGQFETSGISRDNWDAVFGENRELNQELLDRDVRLLSSSAMWVAYTAFNMEDPVVGASDDPEVDRRHRALRQALAHAFNYDEWIQFHNNRLRRPTGPIPPNVSGYVERPVPYPYDLDKARALLVEAGYPEGRDPETGRRLQLTLEIGAADSPDVRQAVELFVQFMDRIGVVIEPSYNHWPAFLEKLSRGQAQLFQLGWVADYPDAENFLQLFYGPNRSPGANHAHYANAEFDRMYEQLRTMGDSSERTALAQRMADVVIKDSPWIFTGIPISYGLLHGWLENFKRHDFAYGMSKYYKVNTEQRQAWRAAYGK